CGAATRAGGATLTCTFGTMAQGSTRQITLSGTTTAADCATPISNTASVSSTNDTNSANNSSTAPTITVQCPDVSVLKTANPATVTAGDSAGYIITVTAGGTGSSTGVTLTDFLPV